MTMSCKGGRFAGVGCNLLDLTRYSHKSFNLLETVSKPVKLNGVYEALLHVAVAVAVHPVFRRVPVTSIK